MFGCPPGRMQPCECDPEEDDRIRPRDVDRFNGPALAPVRASL
jgi:hypothetical protein